MTGRLNAKREGISPRRLPYVCSGWGGQIRGRTTAMIWRPLHQKAGGRLCDRRRGHQHLVPRPMGRRAPLLAPAKDGHGLRIVLELVRQGVEAGEGRIIGFENDVVEVA